MVDLGFKEERELEEGRNERPWESREKNKWRKTGGEQGRKERSE